MCKDRQDGFRLSRIAAIFPPLALSLAAAIGAGGAGDGPESGLHDYATARRYFIEIEKIWRLPDKEQSAKIVSAYRELFLPLEQRRYSQYINPEFPQNRLKLTPEELADLVGKKNYWAALQELGRATCVALMEKHRRELLPAVKDDLRSSNALALKTALRATSILRLTELYEDVVKVFQQKGVVAEYAAYTLRDLNDPRAIRVLIESDPSQPTRYFELLFWLAKGRRPDPTLLRLLDSTNAQIRWQAAYAFRESGDESLLPSVKKLFHDPDAQVRRQAAMIAFSLPEKAWKGVREEVVKLLDDPDVMVRFDVACVFAHRHDKVAAPALLKLLQGKELEDILISNVVQDMNTLTGSYFGYQLGQPRTTATNQAAAQRFAEWIKAH